MGAIHDAGSDPERTLMMTRTDPGCHQLRMIIAAVQVELCVVDDDDVKNNGWFVQNPCAELHTTI